MDRKQVNSLDIQSIGYDKQTSILEVEFISGGIYHYFNIPEYLYQQFLDASSHGKFLHSHIKYNYQYQKIR